VWYLIVFWAAKLDGGYVLQVQLFCKVLWWGPLPDPYTVAFESSTVGSNAAGRLLIAHS